MRLTMPQLLRTLERVLLDRAPQAHAEMTADGTLQAFLEGRAEVISEAAGNASVSATTPEGLTGLDRFQYQTMLDNRCWAEALEEGIADLPDERTEAVEEA